MLMGRIALDILPTKARIKQRGQVEEDQCKKKKKLRAENKKQNSELFCTIILESYPIYKVSVIPYSLIVRAADGFLTIYTVSKIKLWTISTKLGCPAVNLLTKP